MDFIDVVLSMNADVNISVTHNGDKAVIMLAFPRSVAPISPLVVEVDKGEAVDVAAVREGIRAALNDIVEHAIPLAEQVALNQERLKDTKPPKTSTKPESKAVEKAKERMKEDPMPENEATTLMLVSSLEEALKSTDVAHVHKTLTKANELNKTEIKCRPVTRERYDKAYRELNEHYDKLNPSLF